MRTPGARRMPAPVRSRRTRGRSCLARRRAGTPRGHLDLKRTVRFREHHLGRRGEQVQPLQVKLALLEGVPDLILLDRAKDREPVFLSGLVIALGELSEDLSKPVDFLGSDVRGRARPA